MAKKSKVPTTRLTPSDLMRRVNELEGLLSFAGRDRDGFKEGLKQANEKVASITERLGKTERDLGEALKARDAAEKDAAIYREQAIDVEEHRLIDRAWLCTVLLMGDYSGGGKELPSDEAIGLRVEAIMNIVARRAIDAAEKHDGAPKAQDEEGSVLELRNRLDDFRVGIYNGLGLSGAGWDDKSLIAAVKKREDDNRSLAVECGRKDEVRNELYERYIELDREVCGFRRDLAMALGMMNDRGVAMALGMDDLLQRAKDCCMTERVMDGFRTRLAHLLGMMEGKDAAVPGVDEILHRVGAMVRANHAFATSSDEAMDGFRYDLAEALGMLVGKCVALPGADEILCQVRGVCASLVVANRADPMHADPGEPSEERTLRARVVAAEEKPVNVDWSENPKPKAQVSREPREHKDRRGFRLVENGKVVLELDLTDAPAGVRMVMGSLKKST